jgi:serine/threonine protein kinase/Flp pilus assembly protein TadD
MIGKVISHYRITEKIGEGGMGVVYKAEDTALKREVALKFLPYEVSRDPEAKQRFVNEAQAASRLDHNNICNIHEIAETDDGQLFISMAYYEGETLKKKIEHRPLKIDEVLYISEQIAQGLAKAHERGIVHRDIKPANVMLTKDGVAKILDFGLAKSAGRAMLTKTGTTLGTVAYMSPEQARGQEVDSRTDIWSLGTVIYEMVTGQPPFKGDYEHAIVYSIINEIPAPMPALRSGVPMELERIVQKAMAKERNGRYYSAEELLGDIRSLEKGLKFGVSKKEMKQKEPSESRKSGKRKLVLMGLGFLAFVVVSLTVYLLLIHKGESGERIPIAVADFANDTEETVLNGLSGMLITSLEQSRHLSVLTRSGMLDILKQLGKQDFDRIDEVLGREICKRAGLRGLVLASIRKFGRVYAIDLKVLDPKRNEYVFTASEKGEGQESVPSMIDRLSEKTQLGLKMQSDEIQARELRVADMTTLNLDAYQHYFLGEQLIDKLRFEESEKEFRRAVSLDSTFALAYYGLAYAASWHLEEKAMEPMQKAMQYIEKTPKKERQLIRGFNMFLAGNYDESIREYQQVLDSYPREKEAIWMLGDISFHKGDFSLALTYLKKVVEIDPKSERALEHIVYSYLSLEQYEEMLENAKMYVAKVPSEEAYSLMAESYAIRGNFDQAIQVYQRALDLFPANTMPILGVGDVYMYRGDFEKGEREFKKMVDKSPHLNDRREGFRHLSTLNAYLGKYREAVRMLDKVIELDLQMGDSTDLARSYADKSLLLIAGPRDLSEASKTIRRGLELSKCADISSYGDLFTAYMLMNEYKSALEIVKNKLSLRNPFVIFLANGSSLRSRGEYEKAITDLVTAARGWPFLQKLHSWYELANCYIETKQQAKAIDAIQKIQQTYCEGPWPVYSQLRAVVYPKSFWLLGKTHESSGQNKLAAESYRRFLLLWKNADIDLAELVDAKARLKTLERMSEQ